MLCGLPNEIFGSFRGFASFSAQFGSGENFGGKVGGENVGDNFEGIAKENMKSGIEKKIAKW